MKFIRTHKDEPFFLYVPFTIPHVARSIVGPDQRWLLPALLELLARSCSNANNGISNSPRTKLPTAPRD